MRKCRAGTRHSLVKLGWQVPLAPPPRFLASPSPSCPLMFMPQHLTVLSFCSEKQQKITDRLRSGSDTLGKSATQGMQSHRPPKWCWI